MEQIIGLLLMIWLVVRFLLGMVLMLPVMGLGLLAIEKIADAYHCYVDGLENGR